MTLPALAFWSLAVWRFTVLLVYDSITADLRAAVGVTYDEYSEVHGSNIVAEALTCHRCFSVWAAGLATLLIQPALKDAIPTLLALSGGSILLNKLVMGE